MICRLCPRECGVDRSASRGFCGMGEAPRLARAALHQWEEPCISGDPDDSGQTGSGTVFFSGCVMRCVFCQNHDVSAGGFGKDVTVERLADIFLELQQRGAYNINLVSPTPFVPQIIRALDIAKPRLTIPVVYNTGGYERLETLRQLEGLIDIYLPDFKYTRPAKAAAYSAAPDYVERVGPALLEMRRQVQDRWDGDKMLSGMIVRHLILPGNTNSAIEVLNWLHSHLPGTYVSLMAQYTPMPGLERYPELTRAITRREYDKVVDHALALGMDHVFLQERSAVGKDFIPAFDFTGIV